MTKFPSYIPAMLALDHLRCSYDRFIACNIELQEFYGTRLLLGLNVPDGGLALLRRTAPEKNVLRRV
jgi:hypothetical protein